MAGDRRDAGLRVRRLAAAGRARSRTTSPSATSARTRWRCRSAGDELSTRTAAAPTSSGALLRVLGEQAYERDPLRPLRLARLATELSLRARRGDRAADRATRARVPETSPRAHLGRAPPARDRRRVLEGLALADRLGLRRRCCRSSRPPRRRAEPLPPPRRLRPHARGAAAAARARGRPRGVFGELAPRLRAVLDEPLADELTRRQALRFAALVHDMGKPATRASCRTAASRSSGTTRSARSMVSGLCRRLRTSERLASFLGGVTRHHLVLGFLVHERPLDRRAVYRYLRLPSRSRSR